MLRFISKTTRLIQEVLETIEEFPQFISEIVPEAKSLLTNLYSVSEEDLAKGGIEDWTRAFAATLNQTIDGMLENFSRLSGMGLPSPFFEDGSIATTEQIAERIEEEQDPNAFQNFSHPPTAADIEGVIHPLAQLLFHCEVGVSFLDTLPHKEKIDLGEAHENLHKVERPFEDD